MPSLFYRPPRNTACLYQWLGLGTNVTKSLRFLVDPQNFSFCLGFGTDVSTPLVHSRVAFQQAPHVRTSRESQQAVIELLPWHARSSLFFQGFAKLWARVKPREWRSVLQRVHALLSGPHTGLNLFSPRRSVAHETP